MSIKPTLSVPVFGGAVTVHAFGREHNANFSFKGFDNNEERYATHAPIFEALASISQRVEAFAVPSPAKMNAEIVWSGEIPLATSSGPYKDPGERFFIYRGLDADGVRDLNPAVGYAVSAADCALVVVKNKDVVIAAHAGRNSIIDVELMKGPMLRGRKYESVVHAIMDHLKNEGLDLSTTRVWVGFSISPGPHFEHSIFDERNRHNARMVRHIRNTYGKECFKDDGHGGDLGWLDTKELIRRQFIHAGIPENNIELDSVCTYSDKCGDDYLWYSNKRQLVAGEEQKRNLFAVVVN